MRALRVSLCAAALALAAAGCGDHNLVLKVDVMSYLPPSQTGDVFGPIPAAPGGLYVGEQPLVSDLEINLLQGVSSVAEVKTVSIFSSMVVRDSTGSGADTVRVYASDPATDPLTTAPIVVMPVALTPGLTDTLEVALDGDARLAELFASRTMRLTVTTALRGPTAGEALNGRLRMMALNAVVVAGRKI